MVLADCARHVVNDTLNRTVYALDSMVGSQCSSSDSPTTDNTIHVQMTPSTPSSSATPDVQGTTIAACDVTTADYQSSTSTVKFTAMTEGHTLHSTATPEDQVTSTCNTGRESSTDPVTESGDPLSSGGGRERSHSDGVDPTPLSFESRFECGNLRKAIQVNFTTYICMYVHTYMYMQCTYTLIHNIHVHIHYNNIIHI